METTRTALDRYSPLNSLVSFERDKVIIDLIMRLHRRGVDKFPAVINYNWPAGWSFWGMWKNKELLLKAGIEPTYELLFEMYIGLVDKNRLPFGVASQTAPIPRTPENLGVFIKDDKVYVSSRSIACVFEKKHNSVLKSIKYLDCSTDFYGSNFEEVCYKDEKGERHSAFYLTRDGFLFVAMGFMGKETVKYKEAYLKRFNEMEEQLRVSKPSVPTGIQSEIKRIRKHFYVPEGAWGKRARGTVYPTCGVRPS